MSSKTVKDYQGDPIHENVRMFERELKQKFPQLRVTSSFRPRAFTKQGNVSRHSKGEALDLGYDKEVADYLANTYEGVGLLNKHGLGVLDESTKEVMDKTGATGAHLHVGMDSGLVAKAKERYKQLTPKENITPELTDFDFTTQTPTFALEDSNVEEEGAPKEDKSKEVEQAKEVLKEEQFMSDMFKGKITPIQLAQEEAPQQAPQSNLLESFSNIESFVDTPLAQQGLTVPRKKMSLEELDAKMKQTRALLDKGKVQQSNLKERPKEVVRESTQTTFRNETGRQVNTNPNQQISTKHINERRTESQIIADRKKAIDESIKAQDESIIGNPNWRQTLATQTQSTGDKFRIFPNEDSFIDNYLNPAVMVGDMARNLGQAPLQAQQQDSYMPYATSIGTPLAAGAMAGYGTQGNTQFVNNLVNPLAGTGKLIDNLGNKYLPNAYKLNPKAFKPNPEAYYRMIGDEGLVDLKNVGYVRSNPNTFYADKHPFFSKGYPIDGRIGKSVIEDSKYLGNNMIEVGGNNEIGNRFVKNRWADAAPDPNIFVARDKIGINNPNLKVYEKDWLQGYKQAEVPKTTQNFKSEIDWTKWNKEIPDNPQLMQEYNTIEQTSKANGSWMKNSDGSAFQGTPEQFVQQNSQNFKKAFGNTKVTDNLGNPLVTYHGTREKFNIFDMDRKGSRFHGNGVYTSPFQDISVNYSSENGQILMTPKSRDNVYLHEVTHYSDDFPSAMRTVHNQVVGLNKAPKELTQGIYNEKYDYFTDSDEVHARIQVLRKEAGITPEQNVTKEYLDKFLKDYKGDNENINDLLNIADPPHLLEMLNYMASNKDKTIKKGQLAQEGGYTEEEQRFITDYFQQGGIIKDNDKIEIKPSKIEGNGIFVTRDLKKGSSIGLAHTNNQPSTDLGKFHNHSENPNSESFKIGNNRFIITLRDLKKGEEVTVDYRKQPELEQPSDFKK